MKCIKLIGPEQNGTAGVWFALSQNETRRSDFASRAAKFMTHYANGTKRRVALDGPSFQHYWSFVVRKRTIHPFFSFSEIMLK